MTENKTWYLDHYVVDMWKIPPQIDFSDLVHECIVNAGNTHSARWWDNGCLYVRCPIKPLDKPVYDIVWHEVLPN